MSDIKGTKVPIFVVGRQRSGTTMLRLMLNAHPNIAIPFESDFIPKFYRRLDEYGDLGIATNVAHLLDDIAANQFVREGNLIRNRDAILARHPTSYADLIRAMYEIYAEAEGKSRWGDKDPDNIREMDLIWALFPGCKIVHIVRDGRGVANSFRTLEWGSRNLVNLAHEWSWQVTLAHKMGQMIGARHYMELKYEDLVANPEQQLRKICEFVGEPFDAKMLRYHENAASMMPKSGLPYHGSSIQAPDKRKVYAWQDEMSSADRILFDEVAGQALAAFGYNREVHSAGAWRGKYARLKYALIARW